MSTIIQFKDSALLHEALAEIQLDDGKVISVTVCEAGDLVIHKTATILRFPYKTLWRHDAGDVIDRILESRNWNGRGQTKGDTVFGWIIKEILLCRTIGEISVRMDKLIM